MAYVLGKGNNDELIVRMSRDECAQLQGFSSTYCTGFIKSTLDVGQQFSITDLFKEASLALELHKTAISAAKNLKSASTNFLKFFKE